MSSLVLLAVLASYSCFQPVRANERHQVIVVGAGVSGFTAAATLLEHNVTDLIVLEASDRIGGRIHTVEFGGVPIDKGAEFVHGQVNNAVYELVSPYDFLASYQTLMAKELFFFTNTSGYIFDNMYIKPLIDEINSIFVEDGVQHCNGSLGDYFYPRMRVLLDSKHVPPELVEALSHLTTMMESVYTAADDLYKHGAWGLSDSDLAEGDQLIKWKTGGYKTLFDILSKKYPNPSEELPVVNKIILGKEVTRIELSDEGVQVKCADGITYLADHVIVTVSLGVLKKHAASMFHPALPADKTAAIEKIGMGCVGKAFVLFPERWWPNNVTFMIPLLSDEERNNYITKYEHGSWVINTTGLSAVLNNDRMLCVWFVGESCRTMETLPEDQFIDGLMNLLNITIGKTFKIPLPESILRTSWGSYPYTLGSYSYRSVESDKLNITNDALAEPILQGDKPVLLFAGEATHRQFSSTVHGALSTGRREANRLLAYLKTHNEQ